MSKTEKKMVWRGKYLLPVVVVIYSLLFFSKTSIAKAALVISGTILLKVIPIFLVVIVLTALINYSLQPKKIVKHLGQENGFKTWSWALAAGVVSHGPMYAWYPLMADLRSHGMRDGLLITFYASRAIKVPLLPMMVDYFGVLFTLCLSFYILLGALLQGWLVEMLEKRRQD